MERILKFVGCVAVLLVVVGTIIAMIYVMKGYVQDRNKLVNVNVVDQRVIESKLVDISELTTNKYEYSNVIVIKGNKEKFGIDIPLSKSLQIVRYQGSIKAGIDIKDVKIEKVATENGENKFVVTIPQAKIIDNIVDTNKTTVEDVQEGILAGSMTQEIINAINESKGSVEKKIIAEGFLEKSNQRIEKLIKSFIGELDVDDVIYKRE
jgi:hypothetical protein